jgi:WD40-like Beta Propeller Repeat
MNRPIVLLLAFLLLGFAAPVHSITNICPAVGIQTRAPGFQPGGIILTSFDKTNLWVYNVDRDSRYPLPDTRPCNGNCRLSPDARWITFLDPLNNTYSKMRLDGTERTLVTEYATDVEWWSPDRLLIWTPGHQAYLQSEGSVDREYLNVERVVSVQPGGRWGLEVDQEGDGFSRSLVNLETRDLSGIAESRVALGESKAYLNAASWSPDGTALAYVAPGLFDSSINAEGGEIFLIRPGDRAPQQITDLNSLYGATRINGRNSSELSWSPDNTHIAFWVIELLGTNITTNAGNAVIHTLNINTGETTSYCGFSTTEHTPNPPRLLWSPDSSHLAFAGNVPADDKGYLVLALDTATGIFTELSNGIYPALGQADVVAWGLQP